MTIPAQKYNCALGWTENKYFTQPYVEAKLPLVLSYIIIVRSYNKQHFVSRDNKICESMKLSKLCVKKSIGLYIVKKISICHWEPQRKIS